jgi:catechol 2,3-dioxygenase-like lactoylglutathione lyase family enzyme
MCRNLTMVKPISRAFPLRGERRRHTTILSFLVERPPLGSGVLCGAGRGRGIKELGHVVLYVRDLERSRAFYRDLLGFREFFAIPSAAAGYSSGRTHHELLLLSVGPDAQPIPQGRRVGMYHFGLKVGDSDDEGRARRGRRGRRDDRRLDRSRRHPLAVSARSGR